MTGIDHLIIDVDPESAEVVIQISIDHPLLPGSARLGDGLPSSKNVYLFALLALHSYREPPATVALVGPPATRLRTAFKGSRTQWRRLALGGASSRMFEKNDAIGPVAAEIWFRPTVSISLRSFRTEWSLSPHERKVVSSKLARLAGVSLSSIRKRSRVGYPSLSEEDNTREKAGWYSAGGSLARRERDYPLAYLYNSRSAALFEHLGLYPDSIEHRLYCMSNARAMNDTRRFLAAHRIATRLLLANGPHPASLIGRYLFETGSLLNDAGACDESRSILERASLTLEAYCFAHRFSQGIRQIQELLALTQRRLIYLVGQQSPNSALDLFFEMEQRWAPEIGFSGEIFLNLELSKAYMAVLLKDYHSARQILSNPDLLHRGSPWNQLAAKSLLGWIMTTQHDTEGRDFLHAVVKEFQDQKVVPQAMSIHGDYGPFDPSLAIQTGSLPRRDLSRTVVRRLLRRTETVAR